MSEAPSEGRPDAAQRAGAQPAEAQSAEEQPTEAEAMKPLLLERFGPEFVDLVDRMGLTKAAHLRELLDARHDEQHQLAMAWIRAAATLEEDWTAQSRRQTGGEQIGLARYLEIRLPSPSAALAAQRARAAGQAVKPPPAPPPTPREKESAQRRIRLEGAITEARTALQRVDAIDSLVAQDRQAIVAQLEDLISLISRRLNP